ncbi:class I SAM-dependent methyltransferase [Bacillus sp. REN3]|uniref:class I SAM-dependent methyltransferase n=1 Tax=Bacillus sp. REN3 TaxID=2802440 RepID=UPI001AEED37A|nr:class I SAM-dependent methyltransferase [Bacillus sp. REN3]
MKNQWDERFGISEYVYGEGPNKFIEEYATYLKNDQTIVAFAEGEGRNAVYLARLGHDITAWDYSEVGLEKTMTLAAKSNVAIKTERKDLITDPVPEEAFDGGIMVFGHFAKEHQKSVIDKLIKTVKPGGTIMLEVYSEQQINYKTGGPKTADLLYNPANVLEWLQEYKVIHFFYGEKERSEGTGHTGIGHVIQAIVKKEMF